MYESIKRDFSSTEIFERDIRRTDFEIEPFRHRENLKAAWQLINTLVPTAFLWMLVPMVLGGDFSVVRFVIVPILILLVLLSLRSFALMHDCGHDSLFASHWLNRMFGFLLGGLNAIPQHCWSRGHAFHHKHNGNWQKYRGVSALIEVNQFLSLTPRRQWLYAISRHPMILFPGGLFYVIIKPRLSLFIGILEFVVSCLRHLRQKRRKESCIRRSFIREYRSNYWYTNGELADLLVNNVFVISSWLLMGHWLGHGVFWVCYIIVMMFSGAIFIFIFFIQHNFKDSYADATDNWSNLSGALYGSSNLLMHPVLNWFTANIAYHSIHHLCERIPNYQLRACHERNAHLLKVTKRLPLREFLSCSRYILWDAKKKKLVTIEEALTSVK